MPTTPEEASLLAALTAICASQPSSPTVEETCLPRMPPAALISSIARSTEFAMSWP
jgi:hypothetical protein